MSLEIKFNELRALFAIYNSDWLLAISLLLCMRVKKNHDMLGKLSSPMRQLYYLTGLNISSNPVNASISGTISGR